MNVRGRVEGDVVSVSGPVNVAGGVTGVISALSERVTLTPTARVRPADGAPAERLLHHKAGLLA